MIQDLENVKWEATLKTNMGEPARDVYGLGGFHHARVGFYSLETVIGVEQRTGPDTNPRISCIVSKSDSDYGTATTAAEPLG